MILWGINALNHGSSLAVFKEGKLVSQTTSTADILSNDQTVNALNYHGAPDRIFWYERPWVKKARQLYAGQYKTALDMSTLPKRHLTQFKYAKVSYTPVSYTHLTLPTIYSV